MSEFDDIFTASSKEPEEVSVPPFDKDEWIQQKKAEREHAYEMIDQVAGLDEAGLQAGQYDYQSDKDHENKIFADKCLCTFRLFHGFPFLYTLIADASVIIRS